MNRYQLRLWALQGEHQTGRQIESATLTFCSVRARAGIKFILLIDEPESPIAVEHLFRQVSQELLEDTSAINTHPICITPPISQKQKLRERCVCGSLLFTKLINERNPNGSLQVRISEFIKTIFRDVAAAHSSVRARTELLERTYVRADTAFIVHDERAEDVDARLERYSEWDIVEYAEARGQECD